ncbi:MAG: hypothetical protein ABSA02_30490 [Trebonia sp.]|jgi:hypothetical protein
MRADDEHDPLDSWLNQQVQPLPPPPGTFELISRRARGRKLRKLAVTMVSAAAVAAAVAIAVPVGLNLHLTQPPDNGRLSAEGSPTSPAQHSPDGSATPIKSPSPSAAVTHPATQPADLPVPPNFQPSSVTFIGEHTAWVIGPAGTPGKCANKDPFICTSIARTDDAGQTWQGGAAPDTGAPKGSTGVGGVRFLNQSDGWAFGPELWATDDGAKHWTQVDTNGARVTDLEASGGQAYALFATCSTPASGPSADFAADCTSYTLMTATAGSNVWSQVSGVPSGLSNGGHATSAVIQLTGSNGYLLAPNGALYSGAIDGTWSRVGTAPCQPGTAQANGLPGTAQLALSTSSVLAIACNQPSAATPPALYGSDDGGAGWTQAPAAQWANISNLSGIGTATSLAAAPGAAGNLTMATTTGIYVLSTDTGRWSASNATGTGAPPGGFSYVGMTTDEQGVALAADTSLHEIWMTSDGGVTWNPATSITPGN